MKYILYITSIGFQPSMLPSRTNNIFPYGAACGIPMRVGRNNDPDNTGNITSVPHHVMISSHMIPSHMIPSHMIPSHMIPSHMIPSHMIPSHMMPRGVIIERSSSPHFAHSRRHEMMPPRPAPASSWHDEPPRPSSSAWHDEPYRPSSSAWHDEPYRPSSSAWHDEPPRPSSRAAMPSAPSMRDSRAAMPSAPSMRAPHVTTCNVVLTCGNHIVLGMTNSGQCSIITGNVHGNIYEHMQSVLEDQACVSISVDELTSVPLHTRGHVNIARIAVTSNIINHFDQYRRIVRQERCDTNFEQLLFFDSDALHQMYRSGEMTGKSVLRMRSQDKVFRVIDQNSVTCLSYYFEAGMHASD